MKKRRKFHMSKFIIIFVILSIFGFTGLAVYLQFVTSVELSSTLITCFYAFCTTELLALASIRKTKINNNFVDDPTTPENEAEIYSEIYNKGYEDAKNELRQKFFDEGGNGNG